MSETPSTPPKIQWGFLFSSLLMFVFFYLLPVALAMDMNPRSTFDRVWSFAGIIIIAAVAGYFSKRVREPVIASAILAVSFFFITGMDAKASAPGLVFFSLALLGSWWGARAQTLRKKQSPQ